MTSSIRRVALIATSALLACASTASALGGIPGVGKPGAVKGAKYSGKVRNSAVAITVAASGSSASVSIPLAPSYCQGGAGSQVQHTQSAPISKSGAFSAKITYTVRGSKRVFATVTVKGTFIGRLFAGKATSSFTPAKRCSGQSSFTVKTKS
jgi:hypothetical protein